MRELRFSQGSIVGEGALINELAKVTGNAQSILQECNDNGELIYVQFQEEKDGKPLCDVKGRPVLVPMQKFSYMRLKRSLRAQKTLAFVTFDSIVNEQIIILSDLEMLEMVYVAEYEESGFLFLGENYGDNRIGKPLEAKKKWSVVCRAFFCDQKISGECIFSCETRDEADELMKELTQTMIGGKIITISAMDVSDIVVRRKDSLGYISHKFLVNTLSIVNDKFHDVREIIPKINSWEDISLWRDVGTREPFYKQEVNELLMYNLCYVKMGRSVFNLVLSGIPGSAKTSCVTEYAKIFGDGGQVVQAQGATTKGLIPSFGKDTPQDGYLASAGSVKVVDEIFRHVSSQHDNRNMSKLSGAIAEYLSRLLPILTRKKQTYPSGKSEDFEVQMSAALLATDNLRDEVRIALANQVEDDPAVLRRFTIIFLSEDEWLNVKNASDVPADDEVHARLKELWNDTYGYNIESLKRFMQWFRREVRKVKIPDNKVVVRLTDMLVIEGMKRALGIKSEHVDDSTEIKLKSFSRKVDFNDHVRALIECSAMMRSVYEEKMDVLPKGSLVRVKEEDFENAKRIFKRIVDDCGFLFRDAFKASVISTTDTGYKSMSTGSGIKRV